MNPVIVCLNPLYCSSHPSIKQHLYSNCTFSFQFHSTKMTPSKTNSLFSETESSMPPPPPLVKHFTDSEFSSDEVSALLSSPTEYSKELEWMSSTMTFSTNDESKDEQVNYTENGMVLWQFGGGGGDDLSANHLQVAECGDNDGITNTHRIAMKKKSRRQSMVRRRTAYETIGIEDLKLQYGKTRAEAAKSLGVSVPTLKRTCRKHGILSWPLNKKKNKDLSAETNVIDEIPPHPAESSTVIAKVKYGDNFIIFEISSSSNLAVLQEEITKRFNLKDGSFDIRYVDEDGDWILIRKDDDFRLCMRTLQTPKVKMLVLPCSN